MIDLLIKYPTRERPEIFKKIITDYISKLSGKRSVKFIISLDSNDRSCNNQEFINFLESLKNRVTLEYFFGESKNKIDACNRDVPTEDWRVCILVSDDMVPKKHGFDDIILSDMEKYYPDLDGALNYNTHREAFKNRTMVLSIVGKKYYDRFGYIYYPGYKSIYCDNEQTEVAIKLNKLVDIDNTIISHDWSSIKDDLRKKTESGEFRNYDSSLYEERKNKNFYL
jgi:hypothetical protein